MVPLDFMRFPSFGGGEDPKYNPAKILVFPKIQWRELNLET